MIYLTDVHQIKNVILDLTETDILWLDTEVADYNTKKPRLSLIQVLAYPHNLDGDRTYMLDVLDRQDVIDFFIEKIMINKEIKKVFHNAKYDVRFLGKTKANNVFCTLELAKKIPYHFLPVKSKSLKKLTEYLTDFRVNKEEQSSDWGIRPLTKTQLEYAKMDCVYLAQIYHKLIELEKKIKDEEDNTDLESLSKKYQEIYKKWLFFDSAVSYLKEKIKEKMRKDNIRENAYFVLKENKRTTTKVNLQDLINLVNTYHLDIDFAVTLNQEIRDELGDNLNNLTLDTKITIYDTIEEKEMEEEI